MKNNGSVPPRIFFTFDDGPTDPYTPQILDILKEFDAKASFFVCGENVIRFQNIAQRIVNEGHTIGNHTYSHSRMRTFTGLLTREIEKTTTAIHEITGFTTKLFRPPWGFTAPWLKQYLQKNGYTCVRWDLDSQDWKNTPASVIEKRVLGNIQPNAIVDFHDGHEARRMLDRSQTVAALPPILKNLHARGYTLEALPYH